MTLQHPCGGCQTEPCRCGPPLASCRVCGAGVDEDQDEMCDRCHARLSEPPDTDDDDEDER